jgi:hypothetical protein
VRGSAAGRALWLIGGRPAWLSPKGPFSSSIMVAMPLPLVDAARYRRAITEAAALRDHRLNSSDKRIWWSVVHDLLEKHCARPGEAVCQSCGDTWPCDTVRGAVGDIDAGPAGY